MNFEGFEPIFGEAKAEWAAEKPISSPQFLFHVNALDTSHLRIHVTDFQSNTYEAIRSIQQLEDMRDSIGIGGSWSEFIDYFVSSIKSETVKLVLGRPSKSDGAAHAKLVAQKSKGMPLISISLTALLDSASVEAITNLSLQLFKAFRSMKISFLREQERTNQLENVLLGEQEKNRRIQSELEYYTKRQKSQKMHMPSRADVFDTSAINGLQNSPDKVAARPKVKKGVVPAYRRARVRGVSLQDTEVENDGSK